MPEVAATAKAADGATAAKSGDTKYGDSGSSSSGSSGSSDDAKPKHPAFATVTKDFKEIHGLIPMYVKDGDLLAEFNSSLLNRDFIVDDLHRPRHRPGAAAGRHELGRTARRIWQFRKVDDQIQIVRRNVRFTATKGSPEERAVGIRLHR